MEGSDSLLEVTSAGIRSLKTIFKSGYEYKKCGIVLSDLRPKNEQQYSLLSNCIQKSERLSDTISTINLKFGNGTLVAMSSHLKGEIVDFGAKTSPRYTSRMEDILVVYCR